MATDFDIYRKQPWPPLTPITQDRMEYIETGIETNRDDIIALRTNVNSVSSAVNTLSTDKASTSYVDDLIRSLNEMIHSAEGELAWNELLGAGVIYDNATSSVTKTLSSILAEITLNINSVSSSVTTAKNDILERLGTVLVNNIKTNVYTANNSVYKNIEAIKDAIGRNDLGELAFYADNDPQTFTTIYENIYKLSGDLGGVITQINNAAPAPTYANLPDRLNKMDTRITGLETDTLNAHISSVYLNDQNLPTDYSTLDSRFEHLETVVHTNTQDISEKVNITDIVNDLTTTTTNVPLSAAMGRALRQIIGGSYTTENTVASAISAAQAAATTASNNYADNQNAHYNIAEINEAHRDLGVDENQQTIVDSLDKRFDDAEERLDDIEAELTAAHISSVIKDTIEDEETHEITEVNKQYDSIDSRFEAIETHKKAIADEIEAARTSTVIRTEVPAAEEGENSTYTDTTYGSLDARLEAIEAHAAAARSDVNTIAEELGMMTQAGAIEDTNTKVDRLNDNVLALGKEIGMLSDETTLLPLATEIDRESTRIDTIDADLNTATTGVKARLDTAETNINNLLGDLNAATTGVKARITALETNVNDATSGLAATKAIADANAAAISHTVGENGNEDKGGLLERIQALETTPTSATVIINKERIIYNNEGVPTVYTANYVESGNNTPIQPTEKVDYLFETQVGDTIKYFYWKYINNQWEKISGGEGGGSGNGNNNAQVYANYAAFLEAAKDLNKDYYVLLNGIYHHYRYESVDSQAEPIEIGIVIDTTNIKTYNMNYRADTTNNKNYLDLYLFDYGISNTNLDDTLPGVTVFSVELPEGIGGGSALGNNVCKVIQVGQNANSTISQEEAKSVILSIFYQAYEADEDQRTWSNASYTLYKNDMIIESNTFKGNNAALNINPDDEWSHVVDGETVVETLKDNPAYWVNFDVTQYCDVNVTNRFKLVVNSDNGLQRTRNWEIEIISLTIDTRDFDSNLLYDANTNLNIGLTMIGAKGERRIEAIVDGQTSNRIIKNTNETASSITIPAANLSVGAHKIDIRFSQYIGENTDSSYSNTLSLDIMCRDQNNDDLIILSSKYRNVYSNLADIEDEQYAMIEIPYNLYVPNNLEVTISYTNTLNNLITTEELTTGIQYYRFKASGYNEAGTLTTATISCIVDNEVVASINIKLFIKKSEYEIVSTTDSLIFDFNPEGYTNSTTTIAERLWKDKNNSNISLSTNNTFDWVHGGWGYDDTEKAPYFCIKAGSRATINYSLFDLITLGNLDDSGANFKCIFKVTNVSLPEAVFLTSIDETPSTIVNYGSDKLNTKLSLEELKADTLFSKYLNVVEYRIIPYDTKKGKLKTDDTIVAFCVLPNGNGISISEDTINSLKATAEQKAFNSNIQMSYDNIHSLLYIPQNLDEDDENAYDATIEQRQALNALITDDKLTSISEVTSIMNTLSESNDWDEYRETRSYGLLNGYLDNLVKKVLIIDYTHWDVVTTNNFESLEFINSTLFPSLTNEINHKETRNIRVTPTDVTAGQPTVQIDIEYTDVLTPTQEDPNHRTRVYGLILAIRTIDSVLTQGRGLELRAHRSNLYLNNGTLTYPYAEEDIIEYEYNIHVLNQLTEGQRYTSYILAYEDGVPSASILYPVRTNALKQLNPGQLILGSDDCDVYIYRMKFYGKELSNKDILQNFCADAVNSEKAIDRYRNNIKTYTSPETDTVQADPDMISPISIAKACPDLRVIMIEAPSFTTSKNNYVKNTTIRCIKTGIEEGRDAKEDNWIAYNAYHAGQGTSSDAYGAAGRNIDIIFAFNGNEEVVPPKAKNTYRFDKNYKSVVVKGVPIELGNGSIQSYETYLNTIVNLRGIRREEDPEAYEAFISLNHMEGTTLTIDQNGTGKISLSETSVPNNWFNIKLNIASSENTNNALLQKRYDRYLKEIIYKNTAYKNLIPAMNRDPYVKNDMEFFNTIVFIRETDPSITNGKYTKHSEFNDTNWHFYGIGNLGDSKKTDSTRANIPNDPYEFCVEISDNGLTNSGFASGVWYSGEDENHNGTGAQFTASNYGIKYPISAQEWEDPNNGIRNELINYDTEDEGWQHSFEFRYDPNTKDGSIVTTDPAEKAAIELFLVHNREIFANMYEWVVTAPTSGNDSFINTLGTWFLEPSPLYWYLFTERYTMIDSRAKNSFYHYGKVFISDAEYNIITVEKDNISYETTLAILTHENNITSLYELLPSIEENIATLQELIEPLDAESTEAKALKALLKELQELLDETNWNIQQEKAKKQNAEYIMAHRDWFTHDNAEAQYHDGYRFDMWDYDNDTALGINNNGKMVFEAGIEDVDKINDVWVYNEATSVFWCRIRDEGYDKLVSLYAQLKDECFNAEHLIGEFDKWQSEFPENLWRMDFERKYRRPYENGGEVTYLRDMANGRKKYQRREFERNMSVYIHSKYDRMSPYSASDELSFRPVDRGYLINDMSSPGDIGESKIMSIMPYSKIYINMMVGNSADSKIIHERANPGTAYKYNIKEVISSLNGQLQNIQCRLFNASRIQELNGLEHYYADDLKVAAAKKLKKITVGTDYVLNSNNEYILDNNNNPIPYINDKTTTIVLGTSDDANPILETLDIRNCVNLTPTFSLLGCINLKNLYAYGTPITKFDFADNGLLTNLYLPTTILNLTFENLHLLNKITTKTFEQELNGEGVDTYNNLTTYISHNSSDAANSQYILTNAFNKLTTIDLDNINWELASLPDFEIFDQKKKVLEATDSQGNHLGDFILAGTINVLGSWSTIAKENYSRNWDYKIIFNTISERETFLTQVNFYDSSYESDAGLVPAKLLNTIFVDANNIIADPYTSSTALNALPQRNPTKAKVFQFGSLSQSNQYRPYSGWSRYSDCSRLEDTLYGEGRRMTKEEALRASNTTSESINLYSYYSSTPHLYEVQWILDRDHPETIVTPSTNIPLQGYGEGEDLSAPTIADIRKLYSTFEITHVENMTDTYDIRIFKQWEKLPTNIDPSPDEAITNKYTIYGKWETTRVSINNNDENNLFNNISTLNENQLLLLSYLNSKVKSDHNILPTTIVQKLYKYRMGYDGRPNTGILLADSNSNVTPIYTFNEDTDSILVLNNGRYITPFANNNGFTLVIDYAFDERSNPGSASVLVGCYEKDANDTTTTGFALYNIVDSSLGTPGITVGYGDMFNYRTGTQDSHIMRVGSNDAYKRNIIVLRHPKNSSKLIVYSSKSANGYDDIDSTITSSTLSLSTQALNANAKLCFGALRQYPQLDTSSLYANEKAQLTRAYGTIYWAKYWNEDLGDGECKELAAWPHEDMTAIVADMSNNNTSGNRPSIYLTTLNSSTHYTYSPAKINNIPTVTNKETVTGGWNLSDVSTLFNSRIFLALPHKLLAIINNSGIGSKNYEAVWTSNQATMEEGPVFRLTGAISKNMYLYAPSVSSLSDGRFENYNDESILERNGTTSGSIRTLTPYAWISGANGLMNVYEYNNTGWQSASANYEYLNLRFPYKPINISASNKMRIFKINLYNVTNTTFRELINTMNPLLTEGDIVIYQSSSNEVYAYMYINANSLSLSGIKVEPSESPSIFNVGTQGGGWIKSTRYITRSILPALGQTNFIYVKENGEFGEAGSSSTLPTNVNLNYSFTI